MRTLEYAATASEARRLITSHARADYVYMYPPRQAYRPVLARDLDEMVGSSLARREVVNLYFHYPFCRQICAFCNLYSTVTGSGEEHARYTGSLLDELRWYVPRLMGRPVDTVYLGGGTPSSVDPAQIEQLLGELERVGLCSVAAVPEVAMEVSPDSATRARMKEYRSIGINRVNLGVQTTDTTELALIGRRDEMSDHLGGLDNALAAGFDNVCVDLIYGLDGQTEASWVRSLNEMISRRPETICCYPLTVRPSTGLERLGYAPIPNEDMYRRYDVANAMLTDAGYQQETHVRWVLPGGGYRQKANHWAGQDIVGIGAGARGYLSTGDYRNGYSVRHRTAALRAWHERVETIGHGRDSGFILSEDEQRRRAVVLGLGHLDRPSYAEHFGGDVLDDFPRELEALAEVGAIGVQAASVALTPLGQRHRDVLVQLFFSDGVRHRVEAFDYQE